MKLKELRQRLLDRLAEELTPAGYRRRQQSFWREAGPVADVLHVAFINHSGDFDVSLTSLSATTQSRKH